MDKLPVEQDGPTSLWQPIGTAPREGGELINWGPEILCFDGKSIFVANWDGDTSRWDALGYHTVEQTHWMPLPLPPGVEGVARPESSKLIEDLHGVAAILDEGGPDFDAVQGAIVAVSATAQLERNLARAVEMLEDCRTQFKFYADQHRAKGTDDGDRKAATNMEMGGRITTFLATLPGTPAQDDG